jgi:acylphosphatase
MVRYYIVRGRVQGVGFRWFVQSEATALGLKGWVRNTDDGKVELIASGQLSQLAGLRAAIEKGSRGSRVDAIQEADLSEDAAAGLQQFKIEGSW